MKRFLIAAAALSCAMIMAPAIQAEDAFNLAIPLPITGKQANFGEIMKRSYEMAAEEINAKGGILGKKLNLTFEDSAAKPETARAIVEKLIDTNKQPVIVGEYTSACAKAVAAVAEERKTPYIVVASADDDITQKNYQYVFRQNPVNAHYNDAVLDFISKSVKPQSMVILYESSAFGTSGSDAVAAWCEKAGVKVALKEKYEAGSVDFKPLLSKVKAAQADVIYMVSYVMDASLLMKQIKELRIDAKLFAGGAAGFAIPEFVTNAKEAAEYVVTSTLWTPQLTYPGSREFAEKYKAKFKDYPSYHGASAYAALYVLKDAIERAKSFGSEAIRAALKSTNLMTAFGPVKFEDREGYQNQNFTDTLALQVIQGVHQTVWPLKYANAKIIYPIPAWRDRK